MDVILDTNIYRQDLAARSARFDVLLDYVDKTDSHIFLPRLVKDELSGLVARELRDRIARIDSLATDLRHLLPHRPFETALLSVDVDNEVQDYITYLEQRLRVYKSTVVDLKEGYLAEAIRRAIARQRPCSASGEEIRDTVLWLTVLDVAAARPSRTLAFISANTKQFADVAGKLHQDLLADCKSREVTIHYFASLEDFVRHHARRVAFATEDWVAQAVPEAEILEEARPAAFKLFLDSLEWEEGYRLRSTEPSVSSNGLGDCVIYVYEMVDGSFRVVASYSAYYDFVYSEDEEVYYEDMAWSETRQREVRVECFIDVDVVARDEQLIEWHVSKVERSSISHD